MDFRFRERLDVPIELLADKVGRVIHAETTSQLLSQVRDHERLLTYRGLLLARLYAFDVLKEQFPKLSEIPEQIESTELDEPFPKTVYQLMAEVKHHMQGQIEVFAPWMDRFMTSTNLVRGDDEKIYFWDHQLSSDYVKSSIENGLKDGGFNYEAMMGRVKSESYASLEYSEYIEAKGGVFTSEKWQNHPVFSKACANDIHQRRYVEVLDILSSDLFHQPGSHSGWVQSGFPQGYGRLLALGFGEAAFYPPNNSTLGHLGIVVDR